MFAGFFGATSNDLAAVGLDKGPFVGMVKRGEGPSIFGPEGSPVA